MNKLTMLLVLCASFFSAPAMAHEQPNGEHPHCCPACESRCANMFPDTCSPFLNKFRGRRQALCEFRCTRRNGGYLPGHLPATNIGAQRYTVSPPLPPGVYRMHQPADCHIYCNDQHPGGTVSNYLCNERCHRVIATPLVPTPRGAP